MNIEVRLETKLCLLVAMTSLGYATPESLIALNVKLPALGLAALALWFHAGHLQKAKFMLDDWLIVPAWVS